MHQQRYQQRYTGRYVGITDVANAHQAHALLQYFTEHFHATTWRLMIGVMTSYKWWHGDHRKFANVWLPPHLLHSAFLPHPSAFNVLHYADYHDETEPTFLDHVLCSCSEHLQGIQLDMPLPQPALLEMVRKKFPHISTVLQVGTAVFEKMGINHTPEQLVTRLQGMYGVGNSLVDYVLLDCSGGTGTEMQPGVLMSYIRALGSEWPNVHISVAGGIGPDTTDGFTEIVSQVPVSLDAQGKLRPSGKSTDPLDTAYAMRYLQAIANIVA